MKVIEHKHVIPIIRNTLNALDARLVDHGYRVAFLMEQTLCHAGLFKGKELRDIVMTCFLHDIGAYKTEEIEQLIQFETWDIYQHSVYGYLFLKNLSPLGPYADIILYHHIYYRKLRDHDIPYLLVSQLLSLCDRLDVYQLEKPLQTVEAFLRQFEEDYFSKEAIDLFLSADAQCHMLDQLYVQHQEVKVAVFDEIPFTESEGKAYLHMLSYAIDFRSEYMVAHTITTTSVSTTLAALCDYHPTEIEKVYYGALLHDIGKVAIPVTILDFPGRLSPQDMAVMQSHVTYSMKILHGVVDEEIEHIAVRHHEKLNGKGYPLGLKEEALTTSERIVAIADIISALIGKRSYKEAYDLEKIKEILQEMAEGQYLDDRIVQIACDNLPHILQTVKRDCTPVIAMYQEIRRDYEHRIAQLDR